MENPPRQLSELEFLTKLQRILSEGLFVASYKYALLLFDGMLGLTYSSFSPFVQKGG